jgi:hypothetical protein
MEDYVAGRQRVLSGMGYSVENVKTSRPSRGIKGVFAETQNMLLVIHDPGLGIMPDDRTDCRAACL